MEATIHPEGFAMFASLRGTLCFVIASYFAVSVHAQDGWMYFRGNAQRTGVASKQAVWDKRPSWQRPLFLDKLDGFPDEDPDHKAKEIMDKLRADADPGILPGGFPIIVGGMCYYRTDLDVRALALQDVIFDFKFLPGRFVFKGIPFNTSLSMLHYRNESRLMMPTILDALRVQKQEQFIWANATIGSTSSDGRALYAISDFAFPKVELRKGQFGPLKSYVASNELYAYDAATGKLFWDTMANGRDSLFANTFFLGAPVIHEGKLYVLSEKAGELRLLRINTDRKKWKNQSEPDVEESVVVAKIPEAEQIPNHPLRRAQALHIAMAGDLLLCPTHAGVLVAVDRAKMAVEWTYRYREENVAPPALPHWQGACPVVFKDRVLLTAADGTEVLCIDLKGKKQWTAANEKDLYLAAVHDDIVLLVGRANTRALKLEDGKEKWKIELGLPAGIGVQDGSLYYVPLKHDAIAKAPTIWAIDLAKGMKARRVDVPYPDALGNLALDRRLFVSQSATHIAAFPLGAKVK